MKAKPAISILDLMCDRNLAGKTFRKSLFKPDSWRAWKAFLSALFALPMDEAALETYRRHTGRENAPASPVNECFLVCGRRSGKSLIAALVAVFFAAFKDFSGVLVPGETGIVMCLASDRRQAQIIYKYIVAFFNIPILKSLVKNIFKESIELTNQITIEIHTSDYRSIRGFSCVAAICDEVAFWGTEQTQNPDSEVLRALRPALATTGGLLLCISSPYRKAGELWKNFSEFYGKEDPNILVWKADSLSMNPSLPKSVVETAYRRDPSAAASEYGAQFRLDTESFLGDLPVQACIMEGCKELGYDPQTTYVAFCDPSGGRQDSFCLAIAHAEGDVAALDVAREIAAPFNPDFACWEFSTVLKAYHIFEVTGDAYGGEWPRQSFEKNGITYKVSEKTKSEIYLSALPAIMSRSVKLLDNPTLIKQLTGLERKTTAVGRDAVDHTKGFHDDLANACLGALNLASANFDSFGVVEIGRGIMRGLVDAFTFRRKSNVVVMPSAPATAEQPTNCLKCGSANTEPYGTGSAVKIHCRTCGAYCDRFILKIPCPKCGSQTNALAAGERRCTQCGEQFFPEGVEPPKPYRVTRKGFDNPTRKWGFG